MLTDLFTGQYMRWLRDSNIKSYSAALSPALFQLQVWSYPGRHTDCLTDPVFSPDRSRVNPKKTPSKVFFSREFAQTYEFLVKSSVTVSHVLPTHALRLGKNCHVGQGSLLFNKGAVEDGESVHGACGREVLIEGVTQEFHSTIGTQDSDLDGGAVILRVRPRLRLLVDYRSSQQGGR